MHLDHKERDMAVSLDRGPLINSRYERALVPLRAVRHGR